MLNVNLFTGTLAAIRLAVDKDQALVDLVGEGVGTYSSGLTTVSVDLLKAHFAGDPEGWIEWWLWDCDFGRSRCFWRQTGSEQEHSLAEPAAFFAFLSERYRPGKKRRARGKKQEPAT